MDIIQIVWGSNSNSKSFTNWIGTLLEMVIGLLATIELVSGYRERDQCKGYRLLFFTCIAGYFSFSFAWVWPTFCNTQVQHNKYCGFMLGGLYLIFVYPGIQLYQPNFINEPCFLRYYFSPICERFQIELSGGNLI